MGRFCLGAVSTCAPVRLTDSSLCGLRLSAHSSRAAGHHVACVSASWKPSLTFRGTAQLFVQGAAHSAFPRPFGCVGGGPFPLTSRGADPRGFEIRMCGDPGRKRQEGLRGVRPRALSLPAASTRSVCQLYPTACDLELPGLLRRRLPLCRVGIFRGCLWGSHEAREEWAQRSPWLMRLGHPPGLADVCLSGPVPPLCGQDGVWEFGAQPQFLSEGTADLGQLVLGHRIEVVGAGLVGIFWVVRSETY